MIGLAAASVKRKTASNPHLSFCRKSKLMDKFEPSLKFYLPKTHAAVENYRRLASRGNWDVDEDETHIGILIPAEDFKEFFNGMTLIDLTPSDFQTVILDLEGIVSSDKLKEWETNLTVHGFQYDTWYNALGLNCYDITHCLDKELLKQAFVKTESGRPNYVPFIREIRSFSNAGLKEAKELADKLIEFVESENPNICFVVKIDTENRKMTPGVLASRINLAAHLALNNVKYNFHFMPYQVEMPFTEPTILAESVTK